MNAPTGTKRPSGTGMLKTKEKLSEGGLLSLVVEAY
jgi:hypothetical protein